MKLLEFLDIIREDDTSEPGKFVGARLTRESERNLMHWMRETGLRKRVPRARLHITVIGDKTRNFDWTPAVFDPPLEVDASTYKLQRFGGENECVVLTFSCPELEERHNKARKEHGIHYDHDHYQPHITVSVDPKELNNLESLLLPTFPLYIDREYEQPWEHKFNESTERRRKERTNEDILFERNLLNPEMAIDAADRFSDSFAQFGVHVAEWAKRSMRKYVINNFPAKKIIQYELMDIIPPDADKQKIVQGAAVIQYPNDPETFGILSGRTQEQTLSLPVWAANALQRGEEIYFLDSKAIFGRGGLDYQTRMIADWFRNLSRTNPQLLEPHRLNRMSWAQALQGTEKYHEELKRRKEADIEEEGDKELYLDLGQNGQWWKLTGPSCLDREGNLMGHCVADYIDDVESDEAIILSLRDSKNNPHVTVELRPFEMKDAQGIAIEQIKGKENEPPVKKYWPQVEELLKHLKSETTITAGDGMGEEDLLAMGIIIVPFDDNAIIRVSATGDPGDPLDWSIEIKGVIIDMGKEMDYEDESTVEEFSNDNNLNPQELIYNLAKTGEYRIEGFDSDLVVYPTYSWSMKKIG